MRDDRNYDATSPDARPRVRQCQVFEENPLNRLLKLASRARTGGIIGNIPQPDLSTHLRGYLGIESRAFCARCKVVISLSKRNASRLLKSR